MTIVEGAGRFEARKDEATTARNKALTMASAVQLHSYARQLQIEGKQAEAFVSSSATTPRKILISGIVRRTGLNRGCSSAQGDFSNAAKEMNTAA